MGSAIPRRQQPYSFSYKLSVRTSMQCLTVCLSSLRLYYTTYLQLQAKHAACTLLALSTTALWPWPRVQVGIMLGVYNIGPQRRIRCPQWHIQMSMTPKTTTLRQLLTKCTHMNVATSYSQVMDISECMHVTTAYWTVSCHFVLLPVNA